MRLRTRLQRLEARLAPSGSGRPGCGWNGRIAYFTALCDAEGRTLGFKDDRGKQLPGIPHAPACELCRHAIGYILINPVAGRRNVGEGDAEL
jgi:hypothetical protein